MSDDNGGHFRGYTEAQIEAIHHALNEIKSAIAEMQKDLNGIRLWRSKVLGMATGVAAVASVLIDWLRAHWR